MAIGTGMATIGYYSNELGLGEPSKNHTVHVRISPDRRGMNNLSYIGPIIMGVGGEYFIHNLLRN